MADNTDAVIANLPDETLQQLEYTLGLDREALVQLPLPRFARALQKLEVPDRPDARLQHERGSLLGDDGEIARDGAARALSQARAMRSTARGAARSIAGMPSTPAAMMDAPTAGLGSSTTGWRSIGPGNIGGRTRAIVIDPVNRNRLYAAGVGGGVWRSDDGGNHWTPLDDWMANLAICSLVMDPTDRNILYAGTGEGFGNVDAIRGDGIFRTTDGGTTWTQLSATRADPDFFFVNALAITSDGQTLLAGTGNGVFRSGNAGATWTRALGEAIGNLAIDPANDDNAIAGTRFGQAFFSTDGGASWRAATQPAGAAGRVQLTYAAADTATVYASVNTNPSSLWRSGDGGRTYTARGARLAGGADANFLGGQGWYDNAVWAGDPGDVDLLIAGGVDLFRSTDGGDTFAPITTWWSSASAHADHHAIVADPAYDGSSNRRVYFGNDGGVYRTDDVTTVGNNAAAPHTNGWISLNNGYGVTQFYGGAGHIASGTVMGGAQDNGTLRYTPATGPDDWREIFGGDGGDMASDPSDPQVWYGEYVYMEIFRNTNGGSGSQFPGGYITGRYWDAATGWQWKPAPFSVPDVRNQRAQFIAPFVIDPNNPDRILGGGLSLWRTDDAKTPNTDADGPSWAAVKAAIGNDRWTQSITAIAIADGDSDVVVVGHANGNVYRSVDATGASPTWTRVDDNGINANRQCLAICINPDDHDVAYVGLGGFAADNLWRTRDGGNTWADISGALPDAPVRAIAVHPQRSSWVYAATQVGLFASEDGGTTWSPANEGPANVACHDLFWLGCKLVCVTHGRGMFEIELPIANAFPTPQLAYTGSEDYSTTGGDFTRYRFEVANRADYPASLFRASPDLPPCGSNTRSARTWVDLHDGDNDQRLNGFCALSDADDLGQLWFALPRGTTPPGSAYVVLRDRRCPTTYTSPATTITSAARTPSLDTPPPGSTLVGDTITVEWSAAGLAVAQYWLYVGSTLGQKDLYDSGSLGTRTHETVTGLPRDARRIFVRLWYREAGAWKSVDAAYTASSVREPEIVLPAPGSALTGETANFEWADNGTAVAQWWLYVGSAAGNNDLYNSGSLGTRTNEAVTGLPSDGSAVFARLWFRHGGRWASVDARYTAVTRSDPTLTLPAPGSRITRASVTFEWTASGKPVSQWWLYIGDRAGSNAYYSSGSLGTRLSDTVSGLPTDGRALFVRLWFRLDGRWQFADFQFATG